MANETLLSLHICICVCVQLTRRAEGDELQAQVRGKQEELNTADKAHHEALNAAEKAHNAALATVKEQLQDQLHRQKLHMHQQHEQEREAERAKWGLILDRLRQQLASVWPKAYIYMAASPPCCLSVSLAVDYASLAAVFWRQCMHA